LLRRNRRGSRRRRMPRHGRGGRAAGRTGRLLRPSAARLRRARPASLQRRVTRWGNVRRSSRCGDVWRSSRCGHLRRGSWRRCLWHGRRARCGRCVRRGSCGGGARGRRSSRFPSLFLRLRGCGCRQRSRNDKTCRDASVPLEHNTTSCVACINQRREWRAGFACEGAAAYMGLT
jgi:hypothetical protein